jgi:hypothetical protein
MRSKQEPALDAYPLKTAVNTTATRFVKAGYACLYTHNTSRITDARRFL